jgi:DnaB-like helicase C terminal domain
MPHINNKKNKEGKVKFPISIHMLDTLLQYSFSDHSLIYKKSLMNLRSLVETFDMDEFNQDPKLEMSVLMLKKVLEARLDENINKDEFVKEYAMQRVPKFAKDIEEKFNDILILDRNNPLSGDEVNFVNNYIEKRLMYLYFYKHAPRLGDLIAQLKMSETTDIETINGEFEEAVEQLYKDMKSAKSVNQQAAMDFNLSEASAFSTFDSTIEELNKPNNHMKMGIKKLNEMFDGGLENGRTYLIFGLPKSFKSGTLLNMAIWATKYNKNIETKDKTKKPCVLYVTQENSIRETAQRMFTYATGDNVKNYQNREKEAVEILRKEITEQSGCHLEIIYRANKTISTLDLNAICDEMETKGYEVVTLVQDYTKRIRSANPNPDLRLELGNVVDDFTVIAKTRNIPLVSAGQLNREAYRILETALARGRSNIGKDLNASHVGESALMVENVDYGVIINKEIVESTEEEYLTFKLIASRAKKPKTTYFVHPFELDNGLRLQEDVELAKSLSKTQIGEDVKFNPNAARNKNSNGNQNGNMGNEGGNNSNPAPADEDFGKINITNNKFAGLNLDNNSNLGETNEGGIPF